MYTCSDVTTVCAQEALITELERAQSRLGVLEAASGQLAEREQQLQHQRQLLTDSLGHEEQGTSRAHAVVCPFTQSSQDVVYVCRELAWVVHTATPSALRTEGSHYARVYQHTAPHTYTHIHTHTHTRTHTHTHRHTHMKKTKEKGD